MNTWEYLQKFKKPITLNQLQNRLIGRRARKVDDALIKKVGSNLIEQNEYDKNFKGVYLAKLKKAKKAGGIWSKIPGILMIGITGSVASEYPEKDDDIDIFFICENDSLWLSRIMVYLFSRFNGIQIRRPGGVEKDKLCLNLWLEVGKLQIPESKKVLKNAMDSILIKVVYGQMFYKLFLEENAWIGEFVATGYQNKMLILGKENGKSVSKDSNFAYKMINNLCFVLSCWYMKRRGKELVGKKQAFFHP